jgi:peptidoglycan hydrolase-like protein with peptidoglycan-binding domain
MTESRALIRVLVGVAAILIAVVASSVDARGAGPSAERAPVPSRPDARDAAATSAASRCLTWRRSSPTRAYDGGRTAGYSWAWNKVVGPGPPGGSPTRVNRVKEIQCLLDYRGFDSFLTSVPTPPPMEFWQPWGYYYWGGTGHDVAVAQQQCGINPDGIVGPDTWRCLRRDKRW